MKINMLFLSVLAGFFTLFYVSENSIAATHERKSGFSEEQFSASDRDVSVLGRLGKFSVPTEGGSERGIEFHPRGWIVGKEGSQSVDVLEVFPVDQRRISINSTSPTNDYFQLLNKGTGLKLFSCGTSEKEIVTAELATNASECGDWYLEEAGSNYFFLKNRAGNMKLSAEAGKNSATITLAPESWRGEVVQWGYMPTGDDYGFITHRASGKHLFVGEKKPGTPVQLRPSSWVGNFTRWQAGIAGNRQDLTVLMAEDDSLALIDNAIDECCGTVFFNESAGEFGLIMNLTGQGDGFSLEVPPEAEGAVSIGLTLFRGDTGGTPSGISVAVDGDEMGTIKPTSNSGDWVSLAEGGIPLFTLDLPSPLIAGQDLTFLVDVIFGAGNVESLSYQFSRSVELPVLVRKTTLVDTQGDRKRFLYIPEPAFDPTEFQVVGNIADAVKSFRINKITSLIEGQFDSTEIEEFWSFGVLVSNIEFWMMFFKLGVY